MQVIDLKIYDRSKKRIYFSLIVQWWAWGLQGLCSTLWFRSLVSFYLLHLLFPRAVTEIYSAPELARGHVKTKIAFNPHTLFNQVFLIYKVRCRYAWELALSMFPGAAGTVAHFENPFTLLFVFIQLAEAEEECRECTATPYIQDLKYHLPLLFIIN